jgi:hypothetical protein
VLHGDFQEDLLRVPGSTFDGSLTVNDVSKSQTYGVDDAATLDALLEAQTR